MCHGHLPHPVSSLFLVKFYTGEYDSVQSCESGLFTSLFEYTMKKDPILHEIVSSINRNAHYKSPEMQNEVIAILSDLVREDVASDVNNADVPL